MTSNEDTCTSLMKHSLPITTLGNFISSNFENRHSIWSSQFTPMYILKESCAHMPQSSCTKVFMVALFVILKNIPGSHPCLTIKKWIWNRYVLEYYITTERYRCIWYLEWILKTC